MNPVHMEKHSATRQTLAYKGLKKGRIMTGKGTICHWWIWGQLPAGD